ncbi:AbrB/MazE/SpoVT family DNA-binding domain-containing protein [Candidatus Babeliales bacterium]|nr:AbrB/MazE/SpoVT family DNA-binding domain-containing protein [Candidatus Babeliales bacterium]
MLKKLVRYGNSNALVLDKAILELLNIQEGSVVKISTDGRSIILTPHQEPVTQKIAETVTSSEALVAAGVQNTMQNYYPNLSDKQKTTLGAELLALTKKHTDLTLSLEHQMQFQEEATSLKAACNNNMTEFLPLYMNLRNKYVPELPAVEQAIAEFHEKCKILSGGNPTENTQDTQQKIQQEMAQVFTKYKSTQIAASEMINSEEYQHKAQLITEKFEGNLHSAQYMQEMKELMYEFCPDMKLMHQEIEAISQKHS